MADETRLPPEQVSTTKDATGHQAVQMLAIPTFYFNGIEIGSSLSDISVLLMTDGQPLAKLHMSFTTAKTMAENLGAGMAEFEKVTGHSIMTMGEVETRLKAAQETS
ncbi:MAG: hypothetical protein GDA49_13385 [Rhodospirillales bacterium]|nr:hypothetical protein [Rhodospirillales bacterium]